MRIGIVSPALRLGGLDKYSRSLGRQFSAAGHSVEYLETRRRGPWGAWFRGSGFAVRSLPLPPQRSLYRHAVRVARALSDYDAVVVNDDAIARAGLGLVPSWTVAIVVIHGNLASQYETAIGTCDDFDAVVGVSEAIRSQAALALAGRSGSLSCITGGVRVPPEWPNAGRTSGPTLAICYLGRVSDWDKGVFSLPGILRLVREAGVDARLEVAGDGPDLAELRERFTAAGLGGSVVCTGALGETEVERLLERSDVLLLPSRLEGFPLAPLEAMAGGAVPVVTDIPGSTERMIEDGVHGRLVSAGDLPGFADAITALARDRAALRRMSLAGWRRVGAEFTEGRMGAAYLELLERLRSRPRAQARTGRIDQALLGPFPHLPSALVRPARRLQRLTGFPGGSGAR